MFNISPRLSQQTGSGAQDPPRHSHRRRLVLVVLATAGFLVTAVQPASAAISATVQWSSTTHTIWGRGYVSDTNAKAACVILYHGYAMPPRSFVGGPVKASCWNRTSYGMVQSFSSGSYPCYAGIYYSETRLYTNSNPNWFTTGAYRIQRSANYSTGGC